MTSDDLIQSLLAQAPARQLLSELLHHLQERGQLSLPELIQLYETAWGEDQIPLSVFARPLPAGALVKYLHEVNHLTFSQIAVALGRDARTVWGTYQRQRRKRPFSPAPRGQYTLPLSLFRDRSCSILEHVVFHVHTTYHLSNPALAKYLHKSPNSIAVLWKRAREQKGYVHSTKGERP